MQPTTTRRRFVGLLALTAGSSLLAACQASAPAAPAAPTAAPAKPTAAPAPPAAGQAPAPAQPTAAPAAGQAGAAPAAPAAGGVTLDALVEAARKEGVLTAATNVGTGQVEFMQQFKVKYPWVELRHTTLKPSDLAPRLLSEQRNGLFAWDWLVGAGFNTVGSVLGPANAVADMQPLLEGIPADVQDPKLWAGGFPLWRDPQTRDAAVTHLNVSGGYWVNREVVPATELTTFTQLLDPKYKGRIVIYKPSQSTGGSENLAAYLASQGEDFVRKILFDQQAVQSETNQQATEWALTGRYPIGLGLDEGVVEEFQKQGVGTKLTKVLEIPSTYLRSTGIVAVKNPPHPAMARLFLHWFLSQEGQDAWAKLSSPIGTSRRFDVKVHHPDAMPDLSRIGEYKLITGTAAGDATVQKVLDIVNKKA